MADVSNLPPLAPLWLIAVVLFALMTGAAGIGRWLRLQDEKWAAEQGPARGGDGQESYIVGAVTGLLALLLGFTYSLAIDRFEARRNLVLEEANAIGTAYLRVQLLDEPHRTRLSNLLVDYTDNRVAIGSVRRPGATPLLAESDRLATDLWVATVAAFPTIRDYDFSSTFVDSINRLIDLGASRKAARYARVPTIVFALLVVYETMTAGVLGYVLYARRGRATGLVLVVLFGLSLLLILDIDRPTIGTVRESEQPMIWLRDTLAATPPQIFDRDTN